MSAIRILPDHLVNQIAAGEVIERPASALKELVENALDARATRIDVVLRNGGKSYLSVTDNGCGLSPDDMRLALKRHATSKLQDDNLVDIRTMGFRGEALPSIASVARLHLVSHVPGTADAWSFQIEGGHETAPVPVAHPEGTRVEVRDLFFATPARLKFLKSDLAEFSACKDVIIRLSLSRPDVCFSLVHNDQKSLLLPAIASSFDPADAIGARLADLMGADFQENTVSLQAQNGTMTLSGRIGYPTYNKGQATHQYLFVNKRPVRDRLLLSALRVAYGDLMPRDRHAVAVIFLDIAPSDVDINVHPAKAEVRFRDASHVRGFFISAIRQRLAVLGESAPALFNPSSFKSETYNAGYASFSRPFGIESISETPVDLSGQSRRYASLFESAPQHRFSGNTALSTTPDPKIADQPVYPLGSALAQIHNTYILTQTEDGVFLVDQHAAHERLVYERYKQDRAGKGVPCQRLLTPEIVTLDDVRLGLLLENREELNLFGLEIESFGPDCALIRGVPSEIAKNTDMTALVTDLADELLDQGNTRTLQDRLLSFLATRACHHSVRAGRPLNTEEMNALLRQIEKTPQAAQCNHGRPTFIKLSLDQIERLFERR